MTPLEHAKAVGDAVLYEGYLLYPYRASAAKNRVRWQFGVLMPPSFAGEKRGEYADSRTECLLEPRSHATLHLRLRFLQAQQRLDSGWDEAVEREVDAVFRVTDLLGAPREVPFTMPGGQEPGQESSWRRWPITGVLRARADALEGPFGGVRLRADVVNTTDWTDREPTREAALRRALLAAHLVLSVDAGRFLSLLDPPEWARPAAQACRNVRTWPVLIGEPGDEQAMLSAPIILYDYPTIAPESQGELFDCTEIDEILTLRTMALTEQEKREARTTDPKAEQLLDRVDAMPPELLERLHGTVRYLRRATSQVDRRAEITGRPDVPWWDPGADASVSPQTDSVVIAGVPVSAGSKVRLRPGLRRADAQDMFLDGRVATVRAVLSDVDDITHVAVTVDDDPAADLQNTHGRFRYFAPDELEPLERA